jgi:hypothetical protein
MVSSIERIPNWNADSSLVAQSTKASWNAVELANKDSNTIIPCLKACWGLDDCIDMIVLGCEGRSVSCIDSIPACVC